MAVGVALGVTVGVAVGVAVGASPGTPVVLGLTMFNSGVWAKTVMPHEITSANAILNFV